MSSVEVVSLKNKITDRDHALGPALAPVTLLEYGNFECLDCGRFFPVMKHVRNLLGDNLRFVFRHFPSVKTHQHSFPAAIATEAAGIQQRFWEMHDQLFTHQNALTDRDLAVYARRIGLDVQRFEHDMSDDNLRKEIEAKYDRSLFDEHITGTPTIYINELRYSGARDLENILNAIRTADVDGRIQWARKGRGLRNVLDRLKRG